MRAFARVEPRKKARGGRKIVAKTLACEEAFRKAAGGAGVVKGLRVRHDPRVKKRGRD
jgi:hypothetical protein